MAQTKWPEGRLRNPESQAYEVGKEPCRESGGKRASRQSRGLEPRECGVRLLFFIGGEAPAADTIHLSPLLPCPCAYWDGGGGQYLGEEAARDGCGPSRGASLRQQGCGCL